MKDRICKSLRLMSLGFTILSASWVQAQEVLVSLEAEDGIITLPAKVKPTNGTTVAGLSGGKYVGDNDPGSLNIAISNAKKAGVDHLIHFQTRPVSQLSHPKKYGFIITNPPYGERLEEKKDLPALYRTLGQRFAALDSWSLYLITSYENAEQDIGRKADKNRKIYNGMMKTYFYRFQGPRPPRQDR